ncbi:hypothetical protein BGX27_003592 [Mortierella sp. AM989]|nr:hypothetical protein BGX27_003592 [Mortierella sp. AM989]
MYSVQQHTLTDIVSLRSPSRSNRFSILAKARIGDQQVLLQQSQIDHVPNAGWDMEEWFQAIYSKHQASREYYLGRVWGVLTHPLPSSIAPVSPIGSFASSFSSERPVYVVQFYERGSLRSCLDKGEFLSLPDWSAKLTVIKNVALALHYIKCNLHGQQHGAVSSNRVYLDKKGNAFLLWHRVNGSRRDFATGSCQDWRWFSPTAILQLQRELSRGAADPSAVLEVEQDDMYSFGILAWEIATEELPFEAVSLPHELGPHEVSAGARFLKKPPRPLRHFIRQCLWPDKDKRPSWCDLLKQLDDLSEETFMTADDSESEDDMEPVAEFDDPSAVQRIPLDEDRSKVVVMMESALTSTFYRKELPSHLVSITSMTGKKLFREMMLAVIQLSVVLPLSLWFSMPWKLILEGDGEESGVGIRKSTLTAVQASIPIGGYHAGEDKVLVLDCARFKYPPFYATVQELWESLLPTDPETGKCRGYFLITTTAKQKQDIQKRRLQALMREDVASPSFSISTASSTQSSMNPSRSSSPIPREVANGSSLPTIDTQAAKFDPNGSTTNGE